MTAVAAEPLTRTAASPALPLINLLNDLAALAELFRAQLECGSWLNAYLLAAGMSQVAEDYLEADRDLLRKTGKHLRTAVPVVGAVAERVASGIDHRLRMARQRWGRQRAVDEWLSDLAPILDRLAMAVLTGEVSRTESNEIRVDGWRVVARVPALPSDLRRSVIRLPSCFRSFDQQPADMEALARKVAQRVVDKDTSLSVVGLRTSGSYLGPLVAAALVRLGFGDVAALTMRPGAPIRRRAKALLERLEKRRGLALLIDDPPTTGGSLHRAAAQLSRVGIRQDTVILLVPLAQGFDKAPDLISRHQCELLPWSEWSIHDLLASDQVGHTMRRLLGPRWEISSVTPLGEASVSGSGRGHVQRRYRLDLASREGGATHHLDLHVGGAGLGYFGEHALAVSEKLRDFVPHVYGFDRGLLFREWLVGSSRPPVTPAPVIDYLVARNGALRVPEDTALRLDGRLPAWEAVSNLVSGAFGRGWAWARMPLVDPVVKACLAVSAPSVVDGSMGLHNWFGPAAATQGLIKVDYDRRAFANVDLACFDPVADLAAVAVEAELACQPGRFREEYECVTGEQISAERWFLLRFLHVWDRLRLGDGPDSQLRRAMSRVAQSYFAELFFQNVPAGGSGPLCALDVDGVLESEVIGTTSLTTASATALRALLCHHYRPVLMTGRSLVEVMDRCAAFGLAGGVAEYGSLIYDHIRGTTEVIVTKAQLQDLARARQVIERLAGLEMDGAYRHSIRVYRRVADARRTAPDADAIRRALGVHGLNAVVDVIPGDSQVDLVAAGVTKGAALAQLADRLDGAIALAVGDGQRDISAFSFARLAAAPRHAPRTVRAAAGWTAPNPYQAGLADAVGRLLGHRSGSCAACAIPAQPPLRLDLLTLISAQERGLRGMAAAALHVRRSIRRMAAT